MPFRKRFDCRSLRKIIKSCFLFRFLTRYNTQKTGKVSRSIFLSASLTVECAWILPLFFIGMLMLAGCINMLRLQTCVHASLWESAKNLGVYAYSIDKESSGMELFSQAAGCIYVKEQLEKDLEGENWIGLKDGIEGISVSRSVIDTTEVTLRAKYVYQFPASLFLIAKIPFYCECTVYPWIGYNADPNGMGGMDGGGEMVYVTEWESVYHRDPSCSHLQLTVHTILGAQLENKRNIYGEKYDSCNKCTDGVTGYDTYYITPQGDCYHAARTCSGLKRTVRMIRSEDAAALRVCSRCGEGG